MVANIKVARQQAKMATYLWQTADAQRAELERNLSMVPPAPATVLPSPSADQTTQSETPPATTTITIDTYFASVETQTESEDVTTIKQLEEDDVTYKAIIDKAKERLEEARHAANEREDALRKTIEDQRAQLKDTDEKLATTISSFQDIATAQIVTVTRELKDT